ncbi:acyltransferase ChoActase/COT/CPT [Obba rivulosa]|uniref:Acyltransferase ChoActase/COT/CPT n=1 Tax=Obba rivulosa TaxID=1052685 RepID=A0A8E2J4E4_9APHY|nr:acyltransferase ChoActase/COT/CPT [Obba rivulosa]
MLAVRSRLLRRPMQTSRDVHSRPANLGPPARLPRLPVPDLHKTLQKYLKSLEPFLLEDEARGGPPFKESYALREKWANDFEHGLGKLCQERLLALDRASPFNWLDDNFWLKKAYHEYRAPLVINTSWWLAFNNDPNVPREVLSGLSTSARAGITDWQIKRAAWLTHRWLDCKARVERQELYPDTTRTGVWFHDCVSRMFNICRMPQPKCDALSMPAPPQSPHARKIIVFVHDWLYAIEVLDKDLQSLSPGEISRRISAVVGDVVERLTQGEKAVPVGVMTADDRDHWAENLAYLLSLSPQNRDTLQVIQHSAFALSLDHYTYTLPSATTPSTIGLELDTVSEITAHLHNIRSGPTERPARNRWFDKPINLIVESNTRAGALGEHSPVDALVPSMVAEYALVENLDVEEFDRLEQNNNVSARHGWERLDWVTDERLREACEAAERRIIAVVQDSDSGVLDFTDYGTEWIKSTARLSPDAYIQMALQLAWYRTRGEFTATYETALTRLFQHGRTETIRTLSTDSRAFVLAMCDPAVSNQTRYALLRRAIQTHTTLMRHAATGRGIDRHILGLQQMLKTDASEHHLLLDDELCLHSQTWKLSTSGLSAGPLFRGTGFGSSYPDGYGINYLAGPEVIRFGIESKYSCQITSTSRFEQAIRDSLHNMWHICMQGVQAYL